MMTEAHKQKLDHLKSLRTVKEEGLSDLERLTFEYWDEWTGAQYMRRRNPIIEMDDYDFRKSYWSKNGLRKRPQVNNGTICRSCAVTGVWKAL